MNTNVVNVRSIIEKHDDLIRLHMERINSGDVSQLARYVRDCMKDIAGREGKPEVVPTYQEWLTMLNAGENLPLEYLELKGHLRELFGSCQNGIKQEALAENEIARREKNRKRELKEQAQAEQRSREAENQRQLFEKECQSFLEVNKDLVDKFLDIAERKISVLDDYGDENWEALPREILVCLQKIQRRAGDSVDWSAYSEVLEEGDSAEHDGIHIYGKYLWLNDRLSEIFKKHHEERKKTPSPKQAFNNLSGAEFETHIATLLKDNGFVDVRGTPNTGDQGADLIAKRNGKTIVIQAKRYQGSVSNKAVQEVISAVSFYGADEGWVVTNSSFTPSAKELAQKAHIRLVDGYLLTDFKSFLGSVDWLSR